MGSRPLCTVSFMCKGVIGEMESWGWTRRSLSPERVQTFTHCQASHLSFLWAGGGERIRTYRQLGPFSNQHSFPSLGCSTESSLASRVFRLRFGDPRKLSLAKEWLAAFRKVGPWDGGLSSLWWWWGVLNTLLIFLEAKSICLVFHRWRKETVNCLSPVAIFFFFKPTWKLFGIVARKWSFFFHGWGYGHRELKTVNSWITCSNITPKE